MRSDDLLSRLCESRQSLEATLRIVALSSIGVSRSRWLLDNCEPAEAVDALLQGRLPTGLPDPTTEVTARNLDSWRTGLSRQDTEDLYERNLDGSQLIMDSGHDLWPFGFDPDPPVLLFVRGNPEVLAGSRRVAVVGTRRCSAVGRSVAGEMGWTLAEHGVSVVSGLALGIDGAVHRGAGSSPVDPGRIGVVASGLDMVYPPRHADLWNSVVATGVMISETPMGERATRWRFPARNRLIAGLSELVVVVESHARGGALLTVDEAIGRGIDVLAVPGSVLARSCEGTNQLLMDGIPPVRNGRDMVDLLGLRPADHLPAGPSTLPLGFAGDGGGPAGDRPDPFSDRALTPGATAVMEALAGGSATMDSLQETTGIEIGALITLVQQLRRAGMVGIDGAEVTVVEGGGQ